MDALRVDATTGRVSVGHNGGIAGTKLTVHTALMAQNLRAVGTNVEAVATPQRDASNPICQPGIPTPPANLDGRMRGQFAARFLATGQYAPMRLEARVIEMGDRYQGFGGLQPCWPHPDTNLKWCWTQNSGDIRAVLVGTVEPPIDPAIVLKLGANAAPKRFVYYGSLFPPCLREYKTDIAPLSGGDTGRMFGWLDQIDVVRFRYKGETSAHRPHVGYIQEDVPVEFAGTLEHSKLLTERMAFLVATMKELKARHDSLLERLEVLERRRAARVASAPAASPRGLWDH